MVVVVVLVVVVVVVLVCGWRLLSPLDTPAPDKVPLAPPRHRPVLNGPATPYRDIARTFRWHS